MLIHYFIITSFLTGAFTWVLLKVLGMSSLPPKSDSDDGSSGPPPPLPVIVTPPGTRLSYLLTDRQPENSFERA